MSNTNGPFQNPQSEPFSASSYSPPKVMCRVEPSEPVPTPFTIGELLQDAWDIGIKCWQPLLIMGAIIGGVNFIIGFGSYLCTMLSFFLVHHFIRQADAGRIDIGFIIAVAGVVLAVLFVVSLVMVWLYGGQVAYSLAIVRGEQPPVSVLFSGMKYFWNVLIAGANIMVVFLCVHFVLFFAIFAILISLFHVVSNPEPSPVFFAFSVIGTILGAVVMIAAFLFLQTVFCLTYFFVVDRRQGPVEAMKSSYRFVWPQFWTVIGSVLLITVCLLVAGMIPFVGMFLSVPVAFCLYTVLYLKITGQRHGLVTPGGKMTTDGSSQPLTPTF